MLTQLRYSSDLVAKEDAANLLADPAHWALSQVVSPDFPDKPWLVHALPPAPQPRPVPPSDLFVPFNSASPFNTPISATPLLDPNSAAMCAVLGAQDCIINLDQFGVPVYVADLSTPRYLAVAGAAGPNQIGVANRWNGNFIGQVVPIPAGVTPAPGSDHHMVVIDLPNMLAYNFWEFSGPPYNCGYGAAVDLLGNGYAGPLGDATTGSGIPVVAGLIRAYEIEQGHIDHALALAVKGTSIGWRYPATKSDGKGIAQSSIPMGSRIQLDPTLDVATLGLTSGEVTIGKALQKYGAYLRDTSGAPFSVFAESVGDPALAANPYNKAGLIREYFPLRFPRNRWRVIHAV